MAIHIVVVAHHLRLPQAEALAHEVRAAKVFVDHLTLGPNWNHLRALNWGAGQSGHLVILEDDALPVSGFAERASAWIEQHPEDLTSFYLGTGKPPSHQRRVSELIAQAEARSADHITYQHLLHGVSYSLPTEAIKKLQHTTKRAPDLGLGMAWRAATGRHILYTLPSLVDHRDDPSLHHRNSTPPRQAWRLPDAEVRREHDRTEGAAGK